MSTVTNGQKTALPSSMEHKLRTIRKRLIGRVVLRAFAVGSSVLILAMIVCMIVDWALMLFDPAVRISLTAGALLTALAAVLWVGYRPLANALGWAAAARRVDDETPLLEERWTTVFTFQEQDLHPANSTARAMLQHVTSEAVAMETLVEPKTVTRSSSPRRALLSLVGSLLFCAAFLAINWPQTSILLQRFWNPAANITATKLASTSGDLTIPRGETVVLAAKLSGLPRDEAQLTVKYESGINEVFPLESDKETPKQFLHTLRVYESFEYQLTAGDSRTAWHSVTAIDYPLLEKISFRVIPPSYLERSVYEKSWIPSRVKVAQGSVLELRMQPDIPLQKFDLQLVHHPENGEPISETLTLQPGKDRTYVFNLALWNNLSFEPKLLSLHDLSNESTQVCRIEVIPDLAPIARVITPNDQTSVADDDVVKIEFEAHDDHGIETAELVIYDESTREEGKEPEILETRPIDLKEQAHQKHVMAETELDLKELGLQPGQQISLSVRVTDNRKMTAKENEQIAAITRELKQKMAQRAGDSSNERATKMSEESEGSQKSADAQQQMIAASQKTEGEKQPPPADSDKQTLLAQSDTNQTSPTESNPDARPSGNPSESESTSDSDTSANAKDSENRVADATEKNPDGDMNQRENSDNDAAGATDEEKDPGKSPANVAEGSPPNDRNENSKTTDPAENSVAGKDDRDQNRGDSEDKPSGVAKSTDDGEDPTKSETPEEETPGEQVAAKDNQDPDAVDTESPGTAQPAGKDDPNNHVDDDASVAKNENPETTKQEEVETAPLTAGNPEEKPVAQKSPPTALSVADSSTTGMSNPPDNQPERQPQESNVESVPLDKLLALSPQQSDGGQDVESNRKKLKITDRLASVTEKVKERTPKSNIRDRVVAVDKQLAVVETGLQRLLKREIPDADREEQFQRLDRELLSIEENIAGIRDDTRETQFAFVGLQIVEIGRFHVTPARDRVFTAMQTPVGSDSNTSKSLHHVERARELLAALLKSYDKVVQEDKLQKALKETVKLYEIYIDKAHKLMREARQNRHPLDRKMAVIEVDQAYLDRRAEVETLRREIHTEFARMLSDDPRLASRYLDLIERRRDTLLEQLSELTDLQEDLTTEVSGWLAVDEAQRKDLWSLIVDMRLQLADQLASETAEFSEQMVKSLPLSLDADRGTAASTIRFTKNAAQIAREISFETRNLYGNADQPSLEKLSRRTAQLLIRLRQTERALDRLAFEHDVAGADGDVNEVVEYASARLVGLQTVVDRANDWNETLQHILKDEYPPIASNDQQRVAIATELLRVNLLSMETQLQGQFERAAQLAGEEGDVSLPQEVKNLVYELQRLMEGITLNQAAATYSLSVPDLNDAELQQYKALEGFRQAEDLFLKIRRAVVKHLDEYDVPDPTADQLLDPTLDQFLADLEREPNIEQQLGIPNRPQNLRVIADSMQWQQTGGDFLSASMQAAAARMQKAMKKQQEMKQVRREPKDEEDGEAPATPTDLKDLEEMIRRSVARLDEKMEEDQLSAAERRKLEAMKENMKRFLSESSDQPSAEQLWRKIAESDQAAAILKAMARGEAVPDEQWNKILSTLNEGLWQMQGRTPPEEYRKSIEQYQKQFRKLVDGPGAGQSSSSLNENLR